MRSWARLILLSTLGFPAATWAVQDFSFVPLQSPTVATPQMAVIVAAPPSPPSSDILLLSDQPADTDTVYAPPAPPKEEDLTNDGGVNIDVYFRYLTDDVYRGISHNHAADGNNAHAANFQAGTQLSFNLGKLPHPYVGVFTNVNDSDPVSRFQEIRPFFGIDYTLRPLNFDVGYNAYIYPERERLNPSPNTAEFYVKLTLDDSYFFLTDHPILSPYIYSAYDYERNGGFYIEAGLKHDFLLEDFGVTVTPYGDVAYVSNFARQFITISPQDSGFQHYDIGLDVNYSLNSVLHVPARFGQFSLQGYLTYTSAIEKNVLADDELWGGVGLAFRY